MKSRAAPHPSATYPGDMLDHVRAFSTLCRWVDRGERGAFARAAGDLSLDVSVLRRRMHTLATYVGGPRFEGRGSHLHLTARGVRARVHALRTLEAAAELAVVGDDEAGPLRIACTGTIFEEVLPRVLRALRTAYPRLLFRVRRAGAEVARGLVSRGEVDFAIVRSGERPRGMSSVRLGDDRLWLATSPRSAMARARRVSMAAVAREPLVGYSPESSTMKRVMAVLGPLGAAPWLEVDGKAAALAYVAAGLGVAFVSAVATQRPLRVGVALRDVTSAFGAVSFWLVWREAVAPSGPHRRFVDELRTGESRKK